LNETERKKAEEEHQKYLDYRKKHQKINIPVFLYILKILKFFLNVTCILREAIISFLKFGYKEIACNIKILNQKHFLNYMV
jgi:hypothetical protein